MPDTNDVEVLNVRAAQGGNAIDVQATTASETTTLDAGIGDDTVVIDGDNVIANNTFIGNTGTDQYQLNVSDDLAPPPCSRLPASSSRATIRQPRLIAIRSWSTTAAWVSET